MIKIYCIEDINLEKKKRSLNQALVKKAEMIFMSFYDSWGFNYSLREFRLEKFGEIIILENIEEIEKVKYNYINNNKILRTESELSVVDKNLTIERTDVVFSDNYAKTYIWLNSNND